MTSIDDRNEWHEGYDDPGSELERRMLAVRKLVVRVVEAAPPGPVTVVSMCGGQGREVVGALDGHPRADDVRGRLVELDADNAAVARASAESAGLRGLEVVNGDASLSTAYEGLAPVDLVVASGVFGHLDEDDQRRTIGFLRQLCAPGASVVWTSFRRKPSPADRLRQLFVDQQLEEIAHEELGGDEYGFTVTRNRHAGERLPFEAGVSLFSFGSSRRARGQDQDDDLITP